jgi:hypothetical protein
MMKKEKPKATMKKEKKEKPKATMKKEKPKATEPLNHPYHIGENYFIRTVTYHYTGKLIAVYKDELVLEDVAWIADDGRFYDALKTGNFNEIEPYLDGTVIIGRGTISDACIFVNPLPRVQK